MFGSIEAGGTKFVCGIGTGPGDLKTVQFPTTTPEATLAIAINFLQDESRGELKAVGDVLVDQLLFMRRCGFDSFAPEQPIDLAIALRALNQYDFVYQQAADDRTPVWKLRHG